MSACSWGWQWQFGYIWTWMRALIHFFVINVYFAWVIYCCYLSWWVEKIPTLFPGEICKRFESNKQTIRCFSDKARTCIFRYATNLATRARWTYLLTWFTRRVCSNRSLPGRRLSQMRCWLERTATPWQTQREHKTSRTWKEKPPSDSHSLLRFKCQQHLPQTHFLQLPLTQSL